MPFKSDRTVVVGDSALQGLARGVWKAADALSVTYGACGGTVLMSRTGGYLSTRDGVTVSREIEWSDPLEEMGRRILRDACIRVEREAGDGTTTTAILTSALLRQACRFIAAGEDPRQISQDIEQASTLALELVRQISRPLRRRAELHGVCLQATHGDEETARLLTEACMSVGADGMVLVSPARGVESFLEFRECLFFDTGCPTEALLGGQPSREINQPLLALFSHPLTSAKDITSVLEEGSQWPDNPVVLVAPYVEAEALATLALNHKNDNIRCCAVNLPGYGQIQQDLLDDLAAFSGGAVVRRGLGMDPEAFDPAWFGSVRSMEVSSFGASFLAYEQACEEVQARVAELRRQLDVCEFAADRDRLVQRLAQLQGGVAVLRVGGTTEAEIKEKRGRVEDALGTVQGSLRGGVVPGGGRVYQLAAEFVREHGDAGVGAGVLARALEEPVKALLRPLAMGNNLSIHKLIQLRGACEGWAWWGWDAEIREIRDLREDPQIADSAVVAAAAIRTAVSTVSTLINTGAAVCLRRSQR